MINPVVASSRKFLCYKFFAQCHFQFQSTLSHFAASMAQSRYFQKKDLDRCLDIHFFHPTPELKLSYRKCCRELRRVRSWGCWVDRNTFCFHLDKNYKVGNYMLLLHYQEN